MSVEDFSKENVMFQLGIPPVRIDLLTSIPGLDFVPTWSRQSTAPIGGHDIPMVGLEDLITAKEHAGRDPDLIDLAKLKQAQS